MAQERTWPAVAPRAFTANGSTLGVITLSDTKGLKTKQLVNIKNNLGSLNVQVKRVVSKTLLVVGAVDNKIGSWTPLDISSYTVASSAMIEAAEQPKNNIPRDDHYSAIYESDPTVADRVVFVDQYGNFYDDNNPLPIAFDGTISVGNVTIQDDNGDKLNINPDGSVNVNIVSAQTDNKVKNQYGEALAVPAGVETTIVSYVTPLIISSAILQRISVSGENVGRFQVFINGTLVDTRRTYYGGNFSEYFEFAVNTTDGFTLEPGDIVVVKILHSKPYVGDFEGRIQIFEIV